MGWHKFRTTQPEELNWHGQTNRHKKQELEPKAVITPVSNTGQAMEELQQGVANQKHCLTVAKR